MAEHDNPKNSRIFAIIIATVASLIVVVLAIVQFFNIALRDEIEEKVLSRRSSLLRDLRAMEQAKLSRYTWVDQKAGIVHIPVDRAAELVLRDWDKLPQGLVKTEETAPQPAAPAAATAAPPVSPPPAAATAPPPHPRRPQRSREAR